MENNKELFAKAKAAFLIQFATDLIKTLEKKQVEQ